MDDEVTEVVDPQQDLDHATQARIANMDQEIAHVSHQLTELRRIKTQLQRDRSAILAEARAKIHATDAHDSTDYVHTNFPWSKELLRQAKDVFKIENFRMGQEGVCNAAMDVRDVLVVMPTGAGKSLCYQLPALLSDTLTLVISPLLALMADQVYNLREKGIPCALLSSAVPREESGEILSRVRREDPQARIRLLYVTPERVAKSKALLGALQSAYEAGRLGRIVVDEAHCCSALGHDYRPDYNKLSICRRLFPETPVMGLTATLGPHALLDVLKILGMRSVTSLEAAIPRRTVYFRAPLHRPNLLYRVALRPGAAVETYKEMCAYIEQHHCGQSGIVYCLSRKDTHTVAEALHQLSNGTIRTGTYHADIDDGEKQAVHAKWRTGDILVVCATIAFGMGIDKADVRFVFHMCMSKSLDGYYQETGRAGRDGNVADCILLYRPQDVNRLSSMTAGEAGGQEKLYAMLRYAQSPDCRRSLFSRYFAEEGEETPCGHCDNCLRGPPDTLLQDASFAAWKIARTAQDVQSNGGRITLSALADLARGLLGGQYKIADSKGRIANATLRLDIPAVLGSKLEMHRDDAERVVVQMLLQGYLAESFQATAFSVNVYIVPGPSAYKLTRYSMQDAAHLLGIVRFMPCSPCMNLEPHQGKKRKSAGSLANKRSRAKEVVEID